MDQTRSTKKTPPPLGSLLKHWHCPVDRTGMRYFKGLQFLPTAIPEGCALAHNHVRHAIDMPSGHNGFRFWLWRKDEVPDHFKPCKCGWSGLPHYRARGSDERLEAWRERYRCDSWEKIRSWS